MKKYEYQIVKYMHDQFTGEFVNLGAVVYSSNENFLKFKFVKNFKRVSTLFPDAEISNIKQMLNNFGLELDSMSKNLDELFRPSNELFNITNQILPKDNSGLYLSDVKIAIDIDLDFAINRLYTEIVDKYHPIDKKNISDEKVWKKKYKKYFDSQDITRHLTNLTLQTSIDEFRFDKAWKNDKWHCLQPLSLDLQLENNVKDKVYKWAGKIEEISSGDEPVHITFLTSVSENDQSINELVFKRLNFKSGNVITNVVTEANIELFVQEMKSMINEHDESS